MAIPRLVRFKGREQDDNQFDSCPRDSCSGRVEKASGLASDLGLTSDVYACRSCGAAWKAAGDDAPNGKEFYLSYVGGSCDESDAPVDEEYHAYN